MSAPRSASTCTGRIARAICPYCDFNVYRARGADNAPLIEAIAADMRRARSALRQARGDKPLLRRRHAVAAARRRDRAADRCGLARVHARARLRNHARSQSGRCAPVRRASRGGHQSLFRRRAGVRRCGAERARPPARCGGVAARGGGGGARRAQRVSLDLIYAREGQGIEAWRAELQQRADAAGRARFALPAHHRAARQRSRAASRAASSRRRMIETAASLYESDAGDLRRRRLSGLRNFQPRARRGGARAAQSHLLAQRAIGSASAPARTGASRTKARASRSKRSGGPADYIDAVREHGVGWISETPLTNEETADEMLIMGLRIDEGVDLARVEALRGRAHQPRALAWLIEQGLVAARQWARAPHAARTPCGEPDRGGTGV